MDAAFAADAIDGYGANWSGLNYRREHFATTLSPLSFGRYDLQPAMVNTIWDFHKKCWQPLTNEYRITTYGNANGHEQFFTMPCVDIPMAEGDWDPEHGGRLDRFTRAGAYQKIWRYWHAWDRSGGYGDQGPDNVNRHLRRGLAYAIYPAVCCVQGAGGSLDSYRALYRQYVPAMEELSAAGWEPVAATLALARKALGVPPNAELVHRNILPGVPRFSALPAGGVVVRVGADDALALWVGTREQAAQQGFRLAARTLEKLERLFSTEMDQHRRTGGADRQVRRMSVRAPPCPHGAPALKAAISCFSRSR